MQVLSWLKMLIRISTSMMVTVLDSILVHFFYFQIIIGVKTHYFWSWYEKNYILILGKGVKQKFDDTTLTVGTKYSINVIKSHTKFCSSLHYNESNRFLFVNATKIYQFKAKDSDIKKISLAFRKCFRRVFN